MCSICFAISKNNRNFADRNKKNQIMTGVQLNADILRNLGTLAEDEGMLNRVAKYLRRLVSEKQADPTKMTREEFFRRVDEGREQIRRGEATRFSNREEMNKWLNSL